MSTGKVVEERQGGERWIAGTVLHVNTCGAVYFFLVHFSSILTEEITLNPVVEEQSVEKVLEEAKDHQKGKTSED